MPTLAKQLFGVCVGRMVKLRHLQLPGIQIDHFAAGAFSLATQLFDKCSWCSDLAAPSKILLEGNIR